jgi:hypothetical protein
MAVAARSQISSPVNSHLTAALALRYAWISWLTFLLLPFFLFLYVIVNLTDETSARHLASAQVWFVISMAYMAIVVPGAIFWRSQLFKPYWQGQTVSPRQYLKGMFLVWLSLEIGGLLSLTGCLVNHTLLPNLLPALVAFMLFTPLWPSGRAMTRHIGNEDDPEKYEEPR